MKTAAHVVLFILAFVVFYVGLGLGLQYNPWLGTGFWVASAAILIGNILWLVRPQK